MPQLRQGRQPQISPSERDCRTHRRKRLHMGDEPAVTIAEAARLTGMSRKAIRNRVDRGRLPHFLDDEGLRRIAVSDLEAAGLLGERPPASPEPAGHVDRLLTELDRLAAELRIALAEERTARDA
jgi:hypothetical protein